MSAFAKRARHGIFATVAAMLAMFAVGSPARATLIGTDVDVLLTVGGSTVINQTVSVTSPSSFVSASFGGVDYAVFLPDGLSGSDDTSFTFVPFKFTFSPEFRSDVSLTLSSLDIGTVTGVTQVGGFPGAAISFTADSVTLFWSSVEVGLPTYHFDIEVATVPEPGTATVLLAALAVLGFGRQRRAA